MSRPQIGRVVARLDAVSDNRASIQAATDLACRWRARLHGLFIEDEDLLRLAELPFARQTVAAPARKEVLEPGRLADEFQVLAGCARRLVADAAKTHNLEWSFEIVRGASSRRSPADEPGDFIVTQAASLPFAGHVRLPSRLHTTPHQVARPTLLLGHREKRPRPVTALIGDQSGASADLLDFAGELAAVWDGVLTVLGRPADVASSEFASWLKQRVPSGVQLRVETIGLSLRSVSDKLAMLDRGVLALMPGPSADALLSEDLAEYDLLLLP